MAKISIIMPVYNEEKNICECVESIIRQSIYDFQLIIINDGSTDNTFRLLMKYENDERIMLLDSSKIGKNAAFNLGYLNATSDWIVYFAGDDIMPKTSLEEKLKYMEKYDGKKDLAAAFGQLKMISSDKKYDGNIVPKNRKRGICTGTTLIISKRLAEIIFPIPVNYPNEDMWTKMHIDYFAKIKIHIPNIVAVYRIHEGNSLMRTNNFLTMSESMHKRYLIYGEFYNRYKDVLNYNDRIFIEQMIKGEEFRYSSQILKLLRLNKIGLSNMMRYVFHSNKYLYSIRHNLYRLFTGWSS